MSDAVITVENLSKTICWDANRPARVVVKTSFATPSDARAAISHNAVNLLRGRQVFLGDQVEKF